MWLKKSIGKNKSLASFMDGSKGKMKDKGI